MYFEVESMLNEQSKDLSPESNSRGACNHKVHIVKGKGKMKDDNVG